MALDMNDLMALKSFDGGMTPFEQFKVSQMQSKNHTSGVGIAGLVLGTVGTAAAIGAWIFGPTYASAKANMANETAKLLANANQRQLDQLTNLFAAERSERIAGDVTLNQTITDTVSGSQQGTLTAQQAAELSAVQSVQNNLFSQAVMGNLTESAQKVQLYSAPVPCSCPNSCGCNN